MHRASSLCLCSPGKQAGVVQSGEKCTPLFHPWALQEEESREPARQRKERGSGSGKGRYATEEAREKNRQAQQRFRDK